MNIHERDLRREIMKKARVLISSSMLLLSVLTATVSSSAAADVIRHPLPNNSKFPIASAVEVPAALRFDTVGRIAVNLSSEASFSER